VAGLVVGNIGWKRALAPTSQIAVGAFWEYAAFGVNTVVFLMVGLSIDLAKLGGMMPAIVLAYMAIHIGRLVLIYGRFTLLARMDERPLPAKWQHLMVWGNIKGSLTMVLALSLPDAVPNREGLLTITFGVVLLSLLLQGLSLGPVVKAFRITGVSSLKRRFEAEQVQLIRGRAAPAEIEALLAAGALSKTAYERLRSRYQVSIARAERQLRALGTENQSYWDSAFDEVQRRLLMVEKAAVVRASREKLISDETSQEAIADIDARLVVGQPEALEVIEPVERADAG
jgi:CPA1 family monovalent cation:H+ antiporter